MEFSRISGNTSLTALRQAHDARVPLYRGERRRAETRRAHPASKRTSFERRGRSSKELLLSVLFSAPLFSRRSLRWLFQRHGLNKLDVGEIVIFRLTRGEQPEERQQRSGCEVIADVLQTVVRGQPRRDVRRE